MHPKRAARILANIGVALLGLLLLLRVVSLVDTTQANPTGMEERPVLLTNRFSFSADGKRVIFHQEIVPPPPPDDFQVSPEWFGMNIEGGSIRIEEEPEVDLRPFELRNRQIFILVGDGTSLATGSIPGASVTLAELAPDRESIAFHAVDENGTASLYVLNASEELAWLGEESEVSAIAWSPDSQQLAYIAPREGVNQAFRIDRAGSSLSQVTSGPNPITGVTWTEDSKAIVYAEQDLTVPVDEPGSAIWLAGPDGAEPGLLADGLAKITGLFSVDDHRQIAYTQPVPGQPGGEQLFVLDPSTHAVRRVYPPYSIESLHCPEQLPGGAEETPLTFELGNSSLLNASIPVILRSASGPLPVLGDPEENALLIESLDVNAQGTRSMEWGVRSAPGLTTNFSVLIDLGEIYPMDEAHCAVRNTYLGLPRLDFIACVLPLTAPGMLLLVPWLRHQKKRWLWALWLAYPLVIAALVALESGQV